MIELSIASSVALILGLVMTQLLLTLFDGQATINGKGVVRIQVTQALNQISQDVAQAHDQSSLTVNCLLAPSTSRLFLSLPSLDATSGNVIDAQHVFDTICYNLSGTVLQRQVSAATGKRASEVALGWRNVAQNISGVTFTWDSGYPPRKRVTVQLTGSRTERGRAYTDTLSVDLALRNWVH